MCCRGGEVGQEQVKSISSAPGRAPRAGRPAPQHRLGEPSLKEADHRVDAPGTALDHRSPALARELLDRTDRPREPRTRAQKERAHVTEEGYAGRQRLAGVARGELEMAKPGPWARSDVSSRASASGAQPSSEGLASSALRPRARSRARAGSGLRPPARLSSPPDMRNWSSSLR